MPAGPRVAPPRPFAAGAVAVAATIVAAAIAGIPARPVAVVTLRFLSAAAIARPGRIPIDPAIGAAGRPRPLIRAIRADRPLPADRHLSVASMRIDLRRTAIDDVALAGSV
jgi:hypothetical protein